MNYYIEATSNPTKGSTIGFLSMAEAVIGAVHRYNLNSDSSSLLALALPGLVDETKGKLCQIFGNKPEDLAEFMMDPIVMAYIQSRHLSIMIKEASTEGPFYAYYRDRNVEKGPSDYADREYRRLSSRFLAKKNIVVPKSPYAEDYKAITMPQTANQIIVKRFSQSTQQVFFFNIKSVSVNEKTDNKVSSFGFSRANLPVRLPLI
jgi:hypothetical protein